MGYVYYGGIWEGMRGRTSEWTGNGFRLMGRCLRRAPRARHAWPSARAALPTVAAPSPRPLAHSSAGSTSKRLITRLKDASDASIRRSNRFRSWGPPMSTPGSGCAFAPRAGRWSAPIRDGRRRSSWPFVEGRQRSSCISSRATPSALCRLTLMRSLLTLTAERCGSGWRVAAMPPARSNVPGRVERVE